MNELQLHEKSVFKNYYYFLKIFGCVGSQLQHMGSFFVTAHGLLSSCGLQFLSSCVRAL